MEKDKRWAKQFGDFAEHLVLYILGQCKNMSVALVDHVGADIFAVSRENPNKRYAVSIKGRIIPLSESRTYVFDSHNIKGLKETASTFGMEPAIAFVFIDEQEEKRKIRVFFFTLENIEKLCKNSEAEFVKLNYKNEIAFKWTETNQTHYLKNNFKGDNKHKWEKYIDYTEITIDELSNLIPY